LTFLFQSTIPMGFLGSGYWILDAGCWSRVAGKKGSMLKLTGKRDSGKWWKSEDRRFFNS
jgi:hypothetical protein